MSPIPPSVARNSSGSLRSETSSTRPSATRMRRLDTCSPKVPATWWLPPWTSEATTPPSVTYWVPGETGEVNPRGMNRRFSSRSEKPASARSAPVAGSKPSRRFARRVPATTAPGRAGSEASPYERPNPRESVAPRVADSRSSETISTPDTTG